jgi:hypothetical protein
VLVAAFGLALLSIALSRRAPLGLTALGLVITALLLGGSQVDVGALEGARYLGLDWFLLNILVLAMLFVPLEQLFARLPQRVLRPAWTTDLAHFAVSHLLVQVTVLLTLLPAAIFFRWAVHPAVQTAMASQPYVLQFVEIVLVADLSEYAIHRLFHRVPFLWRFHAVHHSSEVMDWLAGSRMHLVDVVVTRALAFVPLYAGLLATGRVRLPGLRVVSRGLHPRQRPLPLRTPRHPDRHAAIPPLTPCGRARGGRQELCRALARARQDLPYLLHAIRALAVRVRYRRAPGAGRLRTTAPVSIHRPMSDTPDLQGGVS